MLYILCPFKYICTFDAEVNSNIYVDLDVDLGHTDDGLEVTWAIS